MTRGRALSTGLALAALLVLVVLAGRGPGVRPLFDGFSPIPEYRFVAPPPAFEAGNRRPEGVRVRVALGATGSAARGFSTPDGQVVITLGPGAVAPRTGDTHVQVVVTPHDGARLAALPDGLRPNGNDYRIAMTYEPSGTPVRELARPGTLVLEVPEISTGVFRSASAGPWEPVDARAVPPRQVVLSIRLAAAGDYLSGTNLPVLPGPTGAADDSMLIGVLVGIGAALLVLTAVLLARRRRHRSRGDSALGVEDV